MLDVRCISSFYRDNKNRVKKQSPLFLYERWGFLEDFRFLFFVSNDMYSVCCLFVLENFAICAIKKVAKMFAKSK